MKTLPAVLLVCLMVAIKPRVLSQVPQAIPYQAIARNSSNTILVNANISIRFSIHDGSASGVVVYREVHNVSTNVNGLFSVNIGSGTPVSGIFSSINWGVNTKYLQVEIDTSGGSSFANMGTEQLMSVPYAIYAAASPIGIVTGNLYGTINPSIPSSSGWQFFGPTSNVILNGNQRVVMNLTCTLGKTGAGGNIFIGLDVGYQLIPGGTVTNAAGAYSINFNPYFASTERNCYSMSGSFKPAAGTYKIGAMINCSVPFYLNYNENLNGTYMIINE